MKSKFHHLKKIRNLEPRRVRKAGGGRILVALVYPGSREEGCASLAMHVLRREVQKQPNACAEWVFWSNGPHPPKSEETQRPASRFDMLAISLSFEEQFASLPLFLARAGIPIRRQDRTMGHPLILVGGMAVRLNPRPILPFVDLVVPGDAENAISGMLQVMEQCRGQSRDLLLERMAEVKGVGIPPGPFVAAFENHGRPASSALEDSSSLFKGMFLVETGRGCPAGCRFCAVGFSRRPPMFFSADQIEAEAQEGLSRGCRVGLVGASLALHPQLLPLVQTLSAQGADLSAASLDPSVLAGPYGEVLLEQIKRSGQRTLTLAIESGSLRLRQVINKHLAEASLEQAIVRLGRLDLVNLKFYFMYGLPSENEDDLTASVQLMKDIQRWFLLTHRGRGQTGMLSVSINPFVPKPHTPFAWNAMPSLAELNRRKELLERGFQGLGGIAVSGTSPRSAVFQCLLDRADESMGGVLEHSNGRWPPSSRLLEKETPHWQELVFGANMERFREPLCVDLGVTADALERERLLGMAGQPTPPCVPSGCRLCGACRH